LRRFPFGEAWGVALLEGGPADFEGRGEELVVDCPGLFGDDEEAKLLVVLELVVDSVHLGLELGFDGKSLPSAWKTLPKGGGEDGHREGGGHAAAEDRYRFEEPGDGEKFLDRAGSYVFALRGLELFLEAADEA
jgi:hypothetical protein